MTEQKLDNICEHIESKIDEEDSEALHECIKVEDIEKALHCMKNNKSPGEDGLLKEILHYLKRCVVKRYVQDAQ